MKYYYNIWRHVESKEIRVSGAHGSLSEAKQSAENIKLTGSKYWDHINTKSFTLKTEQ